MLFHVWETYPFRLLSLFFIRRNFSESTFLQHTTQFKCLILYPVSEYQKEFQLEKTDVKLLNSISNRRMKMIETDTFLHDSMHLFASCWIFSDLNWMHSSERHASEYFRAECFFIGYIDAISFINVAPYQYQVQSHTSIICVYAFIEYGIIFDAEIEDDFNRKMACKCDVYFGWSFIEWLLTLNIDIKYMSGYHLLSNANIK